MTPPMPISADILIAGGRVAGSALAIHLARAGLRVVVVERGRHPSDTLSTHVVQDLELFAELGVRDALLRSGALPMLASRIDLDGVDLSSPHRERPRLCVRRSVLDHALASAAATAGASVLEETAVVGLLRRAGRVSGAIVVQPDGQTASISAPVVVGADGRNSTVARLVGAAKYDVVPNERSAVWRYYEGLPTEAEFRLVRRGADLALCAPCDHGLTLVAAQPPREDTRDWRDPLLLEEVAGRLLGPVGDLLPLARPVGPLRSVRRMDGFFRQSCGPGWALLGDAGHFKDVVAGQGICDALRQARSLAGVLTTASPGPHLDLALQAWWRWRDDDARPMSWLAEDLGRLGTTPLDREVLRVLAGSPRRRRNLQHVLEHRRAPQSVLNPAVIGLALTRAALRPDVSARELRAAAMSGVRREIARRRSLAAPSAGPDATNRPAADRAAQSPGRAGLAA